MVKLLYGTKIHGTVKKQTYKPYSGQMSYCSSDQEFLLILKVKDRPITCDKFAKSNFNIVRYKDHLYGTLYPSIEVYGTSKLNLPSNNRGHYDFKYYFIITCTVMLSAHLLAPTPPSPPPGPPWHHRCSHLAPVYHR